MVLTIAIWAGLGTLAVIAIVLEDARVLLPVLALLPLEERELLDELDAGSGDRAANLLTAPPSAAPVTVRAR